MLVRATDVPFGLSVLCNLQNSIDYVVNLGSKTKCYEAVQWQIYCQCDRQLRPKIM